MGRDIADLRREVDDLKNEIGEADADAGGESAELTDRQKSAIDTVIANAREERPDDLERAETPQEVLSVVTGGPLK